RCFTDISDGIEALFRIIENKDGRCDGQIINIGNPDNEASIKEQVEHHEDRPHQQHAAHYRIHIAQQQATGEVGAETRPREDGF
ncbi:hypothetical protein, partial [Klebsiella michiganensis]|uniref:hypothetical protein n=1 Tax=Klebsiella michiganensis TaxID=1134687 RepID=UPI001E299FB1